MNKKKLLALLMALVMTFSLVPTVAWASFSEGLPWIEDHKTEIMAVDYSTTTDIMGLPAATISTLTADECPDGVNPDYFAGAKLKATPNDAADVFWGKWETEIVMTNNKAIPADALVPMGHYDAYSEVANVDWVPLSALGAIDAKTTIRVIQAALPEEYKEMFAAEVGKTADELLGLPYAAVSQVVEEFDCGVRVTDLSKIQPGTTLTMQLRLYAPEVLDEETVARFTEKGIHLEKDEEVNRYYAVAPADTGAESVVFELPYAVAQIGDDEYASLEAAFAAAKDGETITLLADCAGNGIKAPQGKFTEGLTVDFNGKTYTVDGATVGSTGTETNGFQLLKDNKITFKNGTIASTKAKILVQNYSNLTLEGMTLTLDNANYTSAYTLSNNNGDIVIKDTTINANPAGGFAFDVCRYASYTSVNVEVKGASEINGDVEIYASGSDAKDGFSLKLTSGTLNGDIVMDASAATAMANTPSKATVTKASGFNAAAPTGYYWDSTGKLTKIIGVAAIGTTGYPTLAEAFAAAQDNDIIDVLADCSGDGIVVPQSKFNDKGLTVFFNGHTYTVDGETVGSTGTETNGFQLLKDNTIFFIDGAITSTKAKILVQNYSNLTLQGMTLTLNNPNYTGAYTLSNNNGDVQILGTTINANPAGGFAFDVCRYSSYPSVHVKVGDYTGDWHSVINGNIEISASGGYAKDGFSLDLYDAELNGEIVLDNSVKSLIDNPDYLLTVSVSSNYLNGIPAPAGFAWNEEDCLVKAVAEVNGTGYATLEEAIAAAADDDTVKLLQNIALDRTTTIEKSITIDGNNKTLTVTKHDSGNYALYVIDENEPVQKKLNVAIKDLTMITTGYQVAVMLNGSFESTLALNNVNITCDGECVYANGVTTANATNCTFNRNGMYAENKGGIYYSALMVGYSGALVVDSCTINGNGNGVSAFPSGGTVTLRNTDITVEAINGVADTGYALWSRNDDYKHELATDSVINFHSGKVSGDFNITDLYTAGSNNKHDAKIVINGGVFSKSPADINGVVIKTGYEVIANTDETTKNAYPYTVGEKYTQQSTTDTAVTTTTEDGNTTTSTAFAVDNTNGSYAIKTQVTTTVGDDTPATSTTYKDVGVGTATAAEVAPNVNISSSEGANAKAAVDAYNSNTESATFKATLAANGVANKDNVLKTAAAANAIAKAAAQKTVNVNDIEEAKVILQTTLKAVGTNGDKATVRYDITPVAQLYNAGGDELGEPVALNNEDIEEGQTFTFNIPVPANMEGNRIKVSHVGSNGYATEIGTYAPGTADAKGVRYITVTVDHFSEFELEEDDQNAVVGEMCKVSASIALNDSIDIKFYVKELADEKDSYKVVYSFNGGNEITVLGDDWKETTPGSGKYGFTVASCAAKQMNDTVSFKVYYVDGGNYALVKEVSNYSIRQYCVNKITANSNATLVALCRATLSYGAEAQKYFNYKTEPEQLADSGNMGLTNGEISVPANLNVTALSRANGVGKVTATLNTISKTEINFYVTTNSSIDSIENVSVTKDGTVLDNSLYTSVDPQTDGRTLITIKGLAATDLDAKYVLTFETNNDTSTVTYSALSYCYRKQNTDTTGGISLALYNYYLKAEAYFNSNH